MKKSRNIQKLICVLLAVSFIICPSVINNTVYGDDAPEDEIIIEPVTEPVTEAPVTEPVTEAPVTEPVTEAPVTEPVTEAPVTEPVTEAPVTEPVTEAPVTEPVTEAPVTEPVTEAPVTEPVTEAPVTEPVTEAPVTEPVTEAVTEPVTEPEDDAIDFTALYGTSLYEALVYTRGEDSTAFHTALLTLSDMQLDSLAEILPDAELEAILTAARPNDIRYLYGGSLLARLSAATFNDVFNIKYTILTRRQLDTVIHTAKPALFTDGGLAIYLNSLCYNSACLGAYEYDAYIVSAVNDEASRIVGIDAAYWYSDGSLTFAPASYITEEPPITEETTVEITEDTVAEETTAEETTVAEETTREEETSAPDTGDEYALMLAALLNLPDRDCYAYVNGLSYLQYAEINLIIPQNEAWRLSLKEPVQYTELDTRAFAAYLLGLDKAGSPLVADILNQCVAENDCILNDAYVLGYFTDADLNKWGVYDFTVHYGEVGEEDVGEESLPEYYPAPVTLASPIEQGRMLLRASAPMMMAAPLLLNTENSSGDSALELDKSVEYNEATETYDITLQSFVTGSFEVIEQTKPCDIILVLDQSGSMGDNMSTTSYRYTVCGRESNRDFYNDRSNLWYQVNGGYYKVQINRSNNSNNNSTVYTYSYTNGGSSVLIGSSTGKNTVPPYTFFTRDIQNSSSIKKLDALKNAVAAFVNGIVDKNNDLVLSGESAVAHRIAVIGFASGNPSNSLYANTELFIGSSQYNINNNPKVTDDIYASAFQDVTTTNGRNNLNASINALTANGGTFTNLGMQLANGVIANNPIDFAERDRIVIVFSDGTPGRSGYDSNVANNAIAQGEITKSTYSTKIYTVHIEANPDSNSTSFMQNLSSGAAAGYYKQTTDGEELVNIFQSISSTVGGTTSTLTATAVMKDIISEQFKLPDGCTIMDIRITESPYTGTVSGTRTWGAERASTATASINGKNVLVTGYDYSADENIVTDIDGDPQGNKIIVRFSVVPEQSFFGGNGVYTNGEKSGIYSSVSAASPVERFPHPQVNVRLIYDIDGGEQTIFYGSDADKSKTIFFPTTFNGLTPFDFTPNGANNSHVAVKYELTDDDGEIHTLNIAAGQKFATTGFTTVKAWIDSIIETEGLEPGIYDYDIKVTLIPAAGTEVPGPIVNGGSTVQTAKAYTADAKITVVVGSLTITKNVDKLVSGQSFVFVITRRHNGTTETFYEVINYGDFHGGKSAMKTIYGLKEGAYTVIEDTDWSWRYTLSQTTAQTVSINFDHTTGATVFTNNLDNELRISGEGYAVNQWKTLGGFKRLP